MGSTDDKIRDLLNSTGFPFQHYCADAIAGLPDFQVSMEVPFTDPPSNGPLLGVHGQIDILALRPDHNGSLFLSFVIECKRASEQIKNWIFVPNRHQNPKWPLFGISELGADGGYQLAFTRNVNFEELGYASGGAFDYCINGVEINSSLGALNRQTDEKIFKPLKQVAHSTHALEVAYPKIVEGIDYFRDRTARLLYIPVVLTTANLYLADFNPKAVVHGDIAIGDLQLGVPRRWVTYEFPLPDHLSYTLTRPDGSTAQIGKRTVFIVNYQYISEFFEKALNVVVSSDPPLH